LITKGGCIKKEKCPLPHYGFLVVEWFCQNGIPMKFVCELRDRLIGPNAALMVQKRREKKQRDNLWLFLRKPVGERVALKERNLSTWFANTILSQFLAESKVHFPTCYAHHQ
jgi:hypothetical protein